MYIFYIVYVHFLITFYMHIFEVHFGALLMYIIRSAFKMLKNFLQTHLPLKTKKTVFSNGGVQQ